MGPRARIVFGDSRRMDELGGESVDLIVTSPPYWHIKDYGTQDQIGYGQSLHEYLKDLYRVWYECRKVLRKGGRLCVNIGDQFARSVIYGRYKIIPIHAEVIAQCEGLGFDFMGSIIWQKRTTMNTTGGANVMGSFPYPPNGMIEIDYEYIHIFKRPGESKKVPKEIKDASRLGKDEWKDHFSGHWRFGGSRQIGHEAMFPEELPRRLIRMFTFKGDLVLDPFLGSGTTVKAALDLHRRAIGYEVNENYERTIKEKLRNHIDNIEIIRRRTEFPEPQEIDYVPRIQDAEPRIDPEAFDSKKKRCHRVIGIVDERTVKLSNGATVRLSDVKIIEKERTIRYLNEYVLGKEVTIRPDDKGASSHAHVEARVYLKNGIFVNGYLVKSGLASAD